MSVADGNPPKLGKNSKPGGPSRQISYEPMRDGNAESILSQAEKDEIRIQARKRAQDELKDRATKALLDQYTREERARLIPEEELVEIWLDLAPSSPYIMLDGKQYLHHNYYTVNRAVFAVLTEQMNRGWAHDEQTQVVDAKGHRRFRPPMGIGFSNFAGRVGPWGGNRNLVTDSGTLESAGAASIMRYPGSVEGLSGRSSAG